jgi:hypothetical protein
MQSMALNAQRRVRKGDRVYFTPHTWDYKLSKSTDDIEHEAFRPSPETQALMELKSHNRRPNHLPTRHLKAAQGNQHKSFAKKALGAFAARSELNRLPYSDAFSM